jgi:5'-deoxynucleotidase
MSHFFAYLSRMKFIKRWGLMHSTHPENIQEHSLRVAVIAHALAVIRNRVFGGDVDPERTAVIALYHDASEVLTGDLPRPVKYFNPDIEAAYHAIEGAARERLLGMIPDALRAEYRALFEAAGPDRVHADLVRAADKLCAYVKCLEVSRPATPSSPRRRRRCGIPSRASTSRRSGTSWTPSCPASASPWTSSGERLMARR